MIEIEKIFVNNSTPTIQEEVITLRIENAELKNHRDKLLKNSVIDLQKIDELEKELESYKALDSHYDEIEEDAKRIAEENEQLKERIREAENDSNNCEYWSYTRITELEKQIEKMKPYCKKLCKNYQESLFMNNDCINGVCRNCNKWEVAE